jgi:hypothetical protein
MICNYWYYSPWRIINNNQSAYINGEIIIVNDLVNESRIWFRLLRRKDLAHLYSSNPLIPAKSSQSITFPEDYKLYGMTDNDVIAQIIIPNLIFTGKTCEFLTRVNVGSIKISEIYKKAKCD